MYCVCVVCVCVCFCVPCLCDLIVRTTFPDSCLVWPQYWHAGFGMNLVVFTSVQMPALAVLKFFDINWNLDIRMYFIAQKNNGFKTLIWEILVSCSCLRCRVFYSKHFILLLFPSISQTRNMRWFWNRNRTMIFGGLIFLNFRGQNNDFQKTSFG